MQAMDPHQTHRRAKASLIQRGPEGRLPRCAKVQSPVGFWARFRWRPQWQGLLTGSAALLRTLFRTIGRRVARILEYDLQPLSRGSLRIGVVWFGPMGRTHPGL